MSDIPDAWTTWAERKGIRPTLRGIAEASGLALSTLSRILNGGRTSDDKITTLAATLGVTRDDVYATLRLPAPGDDWAPEHARWLTHDERAALEQLIRAITAGRDIAPTVDEAETVRREVEAAEGVPRVMTQREARLMLRELQSKRSELAARSRLDQAERELLAAYDERIAALEHGLTYTRAEDDPRVQGHESATGT